MKTRVLVIEDNPDNLELMTYLLKEHGYLTISAVDGERGLEKIQREVPDLIICDIQLPKLTGYEIAKKIKKDAALNKIPLIAVTAYSMVGDRDRILATGFDGYISKPIDPEIFIKQMEAYLPEQKHSHCIKSPYLNTHTEDGINKSGITHEKNTKGTILVLDDTTDNGELSRSLLTTVGFKVIVTNTVQQALSYIENSAPDLILSDVHLPDMDGLEFFKSLRKKQHLREIPFIFISSSSTEMIRKEIIELGARYISRPIEPETFLKIINEIWLLHKKSE